MKYRVGDKVRIEGNIMDHQFQTGDIVTIAIVDENEGMYFAKEGVYNRWWVTDDELGDVVEATYSSETFELVNKFMNAHSGKMGDNSRIEWPTAVNITNIYLNMIIDILENGNYLYELERHENILKELNK